MIGDGMGVSQVSTSTMQDPDSPFRLFKEIGFSCTASADNLITDSAAGATALSSGHRTNNHWINVDPDGKPLKTFFEVAEEKGLATGIVVTCTVTHATPAGMIAHIDDRQKETEIATQYPKHHLDVLIGGGLNHFRPQMENHEENVIDKLKANGYSIYTSFDSLAKYKPANKFYAILDSEALPAAIKRNYNLGDLTGIALDQLSKSEQGFVLMVEGSQIDWGGHENNAEQVITEVADFTKAIRKVYEFAKKDGNTLVIITADHETGGTSITGGKKDGKDMKLSFVSKKHTAAMVPVFLYGPSCELFKGVQENYQIGEKILSLVEKK